MERLGRVARRLQGLDQAVETHEMERAHAHENRVSSALGILEDTTELKGPVTVSRFEQDAVGILEFR